MPKPIKKKISRQDIGAEETVRSFMTVAIEKIETNFKQVVIGAAVVLAIVVVIAGAFIAKGSAQKKAEQAFYEGYKAYHGLYDAQALTPLERYERSLASFRRSYEAKSTPQALLYMGYSQHQLGQNDEAIESLKELESKFPGDDVYVPLAIYKSAMVQLKAGRTDEALSTLDRLYANWSGAYGDVALVESARVLVDLGKDDEAVTKYRTIISEYPESPYASEAHLKVGDVDEAVEEGAAQEEAGKEEGTGE